MADSSASEAAEQQVRFRDDVPCARPATRRGGWLRVAVREPVRDVERV
jgi:hypothetical protein